MRRVLLLLPILLSLGIGAAFAEVVTTERGDTFYFTKVRGKAGRKYVRRWMLRHNVVGDKKMIYDTYGYTPHRLRYNGAGVITERWIYYDMGVRFEFDDESNLIGVRDIPVEHRRDWAHK